MTKAKTEEKQEMRNLKLPDAFAVSRILKKMQIKFSYTTDMSMDEIGIEFFKAVIENIGSAEKEVMEFLASMKQVDVKEIEDMDFEELPKLIEEFKELKGIKSFFGSVSKLMK